MTDFTAHQLSIMAVTEINPTTELALFWRRVITILDFIYIYDAVIMQSMMLCS